MLPPKRPVFDVREPSAHSGTRFRSANGLKSSTFLNRIASAGGPLSKPRRRPKAQQAKVEPLEPRILLSADLAPFAVAMSADQNDLTIGYDPVTDLIEVHDTMTGTVVAQQLRAETSAVEITGTDGDDRLTLDQAGTYIFPGGILFDGAGGTDDLVGPDIDSTWIIDGIDSGSVEGVDFDAVEQLTGGVGNEDVFVLLAGAQSTGGLEGGAGGFDTVDVETGGAAVAHLLTGPDSGAITVGDLTTVYTGMEPVNSAVAPNFEFTFDNTDNTDITLSFVTAVNGNTDRFELDAPWIETQIFDVDNTTTSVIINLGGGADAITVSGIEGTALDGKLTINAGLGNDTITLGNDFGDLTVEGQGGADTIDVASSATSVVSASTITTTNDTATYAGVESITGANIDITLDNITAALNEVFDEIRDTLDGLEELNEFAQALPLIGGSDLFDQAEVTLGEALDLVDALDRIRAAAINALEEEAAGALTLAASQVESVLDSVGAIASGIAPAVLSIAEATASQIEDAVTSNIGQFSFKIDAVIDGVGTVSETIVVTAAEVNALALGATDGAEALEALIAEKIAALSSEINGAIAAVYDNGRLAFQVVDSAVTQLEVIAGAGDTLAQAVLGFATTVDDAQRLIAAEIQERLTSLGDLAVSLDVTDFAITGVNTFFIDFAVKAGRSTGFSFDFGTSGTAQGLSFDASGDLTLAAGFLFDADATINASVPSNVTFTGNLTEIGIGGAITEASLDVAASVGILQGNASGSVSLQAGVSASGSFAFSASTDGAGLYSAISGSISPTGFQYTDPTTFTFNGSPDATASLEFTADAGIVNGTLLITIGSFDPFTNTDPTVTFSAGIGTDLPDFSNFNNLLLTEIVRAIGDFADWLQDAADSALLNEIEIPFLDGAIDDVARIGQIVSNALLYDVGADGEADGDDRLVTDLNNALQAAGLDKFLRAEGDGSSIDIKIIDPAVDGIEITAGTGLGELGITIGDQAADLLGLGAILSGQLGANLRATVKVTIDGEDDFFELALDQADTEDNTGIGDDVAKLLDRFNAPTFTSVQDFLVRLDAIGVLPFAIPDLNDLSAFYDDVQDRLSFDIDIGGSDLFDVELPADFELDLGGILDVASTTRLVVSGGATFQLGLGFDLTAVADAGPGNLFPSNSTVLTDATLLSDLGLSIKEDQAITGAVTPPATADLSFTLLVDNVGQTVNLSGYDLTNDDLTALAANIEGQLTGVTVSIDRPDGDDGPGLLRFSHGGTTLEIDESVSDFDSSAGAGLLGLFGLGEVDGGADLVTTSAIDLGRAVGVFETDQKITLALNDGGTITNVDITLPANNAIRVVDGVLVGMNRNIVDVVADVRTALLTAQDASDDSAFSLEDIIEVGFQGTRLVLTLVSDDYDDFSVVGSSGDFLGFDTGATSDTNDLILHLDTDGDLEAESEIAVDLTGSTTLGDVLEALTDALDGTANGLTDDLNRAAMITVDDATTSADEAGKSLTVKYDSGGTKLLAISGTNASSAGAVLGILGVDVQLDADGNQLDPDEVIDGTIRGNEIGGVTLLDRFYFEVNDTGATADLASVNLSATAGRLVDDLVLFDAAGQTGLFSSSIDLREYVTTGDPGDPKIQIEIKDVSGFADGTYEIDRVASGDFLDDTVEGVILKQVGGGADVDLGDFDQTGGRGIIDTGIGATAGLGFLGVELTGLADIGATLNLGLNAATGDAADGGILSVGEVVEIVREGGLDGILDLFAFPELIPTVANTTETPTPSPTTLFGEAALSLRLQEGSSGFEAIANDLIGNAGVADVAIRLLALGDPFMKARFGDAGGFNVAGANSFTVNEDFTDLLIEDATIRFEIANPASGQEDNPYIFDAKLDAVSYTAGSPGSTTVTLSDITEVSGFEAANSPTADLDLAAGTALTDFANITIRPSVEVDLPDVGAIFQDGFGEFDLDTLLDALEMLAEFLEDLEGFEFLDQKIPVIDKSISDLFSMASDLRDFIDGLRENPAGSLQFIENALNDAIGLSEQALELAYDATYGTSNLTDDAPDDSFLIGYDVAEEMLTFTLNFGAGFSEAINVGLSDIPFAGDLFATLGLDTDGSGNSPLSLTGSAGLATSGGIFLTLGLGIDIGELADNATDNDANTGVEDAFYVLDSSNLNASISASGSDLAFSAGLGPFALAIQNNGSDAAFIDVAAGAGVNKVTLNSDWTNGRARIADILADQNDPNKIDIGNLFKVGGNQGLSGTEFGTIEGRLPVFFPTDANHIGDILIGSTVTSTYGNVTDDVGVLANFQNITFVTEATELDTLTANDLAIDVSQITAFLTDFDFSSFSIFDNLRLAVDGFDSLLGLLEDNVFGALSDLNIPLVGDSFGDAANVIGDFRDGFLGQFRALIEQVEDAADDFTDPDKNLISALLFDLLGPEGLDLLKELDSGGTGTGLAGDYIALDAEALRQVFFEGASFEQSNIAWQFELGQEFTEDNGNPLLDVPLDFDLSIPGLGLESDADMKMNLTWGLRLGFGLSAQDGFYFTFDDSEDANDLTVGKELFLDVEVLPMGTITGKLGPLALTAETVDGGRNNGGPLDGIDTGVTAAIGIDITQDGASADMIGLTDIPKLGLDMAFDLVAAAVLDLDLGLDPDLVGGGVANGFPSIGAEFDFLWTLGDTITLIGPGGGDDLGDGLSLGIDYLAFNNVTLDLGGFINDVLGPIVDAVSEYTKPLQPLIDFVTSPVPLVDAFGVELTFLDLAATFGNFNPGFIEALAEVITLINEVAELREGGVDAILLPIGSFVIFDETDPMMDDNPFDSGFDSQRLFSERDAAGEFANLAGDLENYLNNSSNFSQGSDGAKASQTVTRLGGGGSFAFPIIEDPSQIFGLLMGNPATLITYDLEPLIVGFEKSFFFSIFGPLGVSLGLEVEFTADFAFGYDTKGITDFVDSDFSNPLLLANGLFVSDTENPDGSGADVPELILFGGITAAAELNLGIARAGVAGGLYIEILFDLFDPDNDGRVRLDELVTNFLNQTKAPTDAEKLLAPLAIFDVTGEIFARLFAFLKIDFGFFEIDKEFDIVDPITLFEFEIDFFRPPTLAAETPEGDLIINIGEFADQRILGDRLDDSEVVTIVNNGLSGGYYDVQIYTDNVNAFGQDSAIQSNPQNYRIKAGETLTVRGGQGDDEIYLVGWDGDEVTFDIEGGVGDDIIHFDSAGPGASNTTFNRLIGGLGNDQITGSSGRDLIIGGAGDDIVSGGAGADLVLGDDAEFFQRTLAVGLGGNAGLDTVSGGDGNDIVIGGAGQDIVSGDAGQDLILGDGGTITFATENGQKIFDDVLALHEGGVTDTDGTGEGSADVIEGGADEDVIFASGGDDTVYGNDAANTSPGDDGSDFIVAGLGFDTVYGHGGADVLIGDVGGINESLLNTNPGNKNLLVGNVTAVTNSSFLLDLSERLAIAAGGAGDTIHAGDDDDLVIAGDGNDTVYGDDGNDLIFGGIGADRLFGDNDSLVGAGLNNADAIFGEAQGDLIEGGIGQDILDGGSGPDFLFGDEGIDTLIITTGSDEANGGEDGDIYRVNLSGGTAESLITILDDGTSGADILEVNGTDRADRILLRSDLSGANAFIAGLNGDFNVERVNYGDTMERIVVNGGAGDDMFASDDTAAEITINGESGDDMFQVGQLFREDRSLNLDNGAIDTGIDGEDLFLTIEVTRGWLSNGISEPMTINGGIGDDLFVVYHNKKVLTLNGEAGDDIFEVRAFALAGSQEPERERTDLTGGAGADLVRYAVNAPVNINGGDGFDTLIVIGTEFGDDFVITDDGVFGAGLNVNFVNIESLRVDGAEGNDRFFVQSTLDTVLTELFGGLGDDTFNASGDTPPVVSNDLRGHSGLITHEIEQTGDARYDGLKVFGIAANVADNDIPFAIITESQGSTQVTEGDAVGDSYTIVLTKAPTEDVLVTIGAPIPSPSQREQGIRQFRLEAGTNAVQDSISTDGASMVLRFTSANWQTAQEVRVIADGELNDYPGKLFTRDDLLTALGDDPIAPFTYSDGDPVDPFNAEFFTTDWDDTAYEGQTNAVITHSFASGVTINGNSGSDIVAVGSDTITIKKLAGLSQTNMLGKTISISKGDGFGEFRFITGITDTGANFELQLSQEWNTFKTPTTGSEFIVRIDDSIAGTVDSFTETKAEEIFDDRTVISGLDGTGATINWASVGGDLNGFVFQIIGGKGAGQELLIIGQDGNDLTLNGIFSTDPDSDSVFRIQRYDGLASQVVEVTVEDNDAPTLAIDQTLQFDGTTISDDDETITMVIEGSDLNAPGEGDAVKLSLTQPLTAGQSAVLELDYDTSQIKVVKAGNLNGAAITQLAYNSGTMSHDVVIIAVDDDLREGMHSEQIKFNLSSFVGIAADLQDSETINLTIPETSEISSFGLTYVPDAITGLTVDGIAQVEGTDYIVIEGSNTILFIEPPAQNSDAVEPREVSGEIVVSYDYTLPTYQSLQNFAGSLLVKIADDDAPTLLVRESGGRTDVIESGVNGTGGIDTDISTDTYEIVLTAQPTDDVTINVAETITKSTKTGGIRFDNKQVMIVDAARDSDGDGVFETSLLLNYQQVTDASNNLIFDEDGRPVYAFDITFTDQNWDQVIQLTVAAIDDYVDPVDSQYNALDDDVVDGDDTQVFAPGPSTLSGILGPVIVDGAGGSGSLSGLNEPLMLPGERNVKEPSGDFLASDIDNTPGTTTLTVDRADMDEALMIDLRLRADANDDGIGDDIQGAATDAELDKLVGKTLELTRAPAAPDAVDQFRLITGISYDANTVTFTLNAPYELNDIDPGTPDNPADDLAQSFDPLKAGQPGFAGSQNDVDDSDPTSPYDDPVNRYVITAESLNFFVDETEAVDVLFVHNNDDPADTLPGDPTRLTSNRLTGLNMGPDTVIGERARQGGITFGELEVIDITLGQGYDNLQIDGTATRSDGYETLTIIRTGTEVPIDPSLTTNPLLNADVGDFVSVNLRTTELTLADGVGFAFTNPEALTGFETVVTPTGLTGAATDEFTGQLLRLVEAADPLNVLAERWITGNTATTLSVDNPLEDIEGLDAATEVAWQIVDPADGRLAVDLQGGDDTFIASAETDVDLVVFGGAGTDTITTGLGNDVVLGDVGRVDYLNEDGAIVTRLGQTPDVFLGSVVGRFGEASNILTDQTIFPLADLSNPLDYTDPYESADTGLIGLFVDINNGTGFREDPRLIIDNTEDGDNGGLDLLTISPVLAETLDATSEFRISTLPEDQTDGFNWDVGRILAIADAGGAADVIDTGAGDDVVMGGEGQDELTLGAGDDIGFGDLGVVENTFRTGTIFPTDVPAFIATVLDGVFAIELGTGDSDLIRGNAGADILVGGIGSDALYGDDETGSAAGTDGDDTILGDVGFLDFTDGILGTVETYRSVGAADVIYGNAGGDTILGGLGGDIIFGDANIANLGAFDGDDTILGDHGRMDYAFDFDLDGAAYTSTVSSIVGVLEVLFDADDIITGNAGSDVILGGAGADILDGDNTAGSAGALDGGDTIIGDTGTLTYSTFAGVTSLLQRAETRDVDATTGAADTIRGRAGGDLILGSVGGDLIYGDDASGTIGAADGDDVILGDHGVVDYDTSFGASLLEQIVTVFRDGGGADVITGNAGADIALGGADADTIDGDNQAGSNGAADGDDWLAGDDAILSFAVFGATSQLARIATTSLSAVTGAGDTIRGRAGNDLILGGIGADTLFGDGEDAVIDGSDAAIDGDDVILGDNGEIVFDLDAGTPNYTTIDLVQSFGIGEMGGFGGDDIIAGNAASDWIIGGFGADTVHGNGVGDETPGEDSADILIGDNGQIISVGGEVSEVRSTDDTAPAGPWNDLLVGDSGGDLMFGGLGSDTIHGDESDAAIDALDSTLDGADRILGDNGEILFGLDAGAPDFSTLDLMQSFDINEAGGFGDADIISGNAAGDWIIGGFGSDVISGNGLANANPEADGADVILGDNGVISLVAGQFSEIRSKDLTGGLFDADDAITGDSAGDIILGGLGADVIRGEHTRIDDTGEDGADVILGDNGEVIFNLDALNTFNTIRTLAFTTGTNTERGAADIISGNTADDVILGGTGGDFIEAGQNDDIVLGDHGELLYENGIVITLSILENAFGGDDTILGDEHEDIVIGGFGSDILDGDNIAGNTDANAVNGGRDLVIGDNVSLTRAGLLLGDVTDPRFRMLDGTGRLYGVTGGPLDNGNTDSQVLVDGTAQNNPDGAAVWADFDIDLLDHDQAGFDAGLFGDDYIAGGAAQDIIFGQLGDDTIQGDGSVLSKLATLPGFADPNFTFDLVPGGAVFAERLGTGALSLTASFEAATDDDDYIEGNGGNDVIFGGLGQDDIVGDNSALFSLDFDERTFEAATGSDIIFGGAGTRIDRNEYIEDRSFDGATPLGETDIALEDRHSRDADTIMGDNANIFRIVVGDLGSASGTAFETFAYDAINDLPDEHYNQSGTPGTVTHDGSRGADRLVVRAAELIDYTEGGDDFDTGPLDGGVGAADEIHGESGDDTIYGMLGNDILFGDSEDDDIIAGQGSDWVSGGTGKDGVIGSDGRIFTSRNLDAGGSGNGFSEEIFGIEYVDVNEIISTPGKIQEALIHLEGALKKTVDLTPFFPTQDGAPQELVDISDTQNFDDNDIVFGGLGGDFLHGGFGSDAMSGAEAINSPTALLPFSFHNPGNPSDPSSLPGGVLNFGNGVDSQGNARPNEFAAYDEFDPRREVFYDPTDGYSFSDAPGAIPFLLNFDPTDGAGTDPITGDGPAVASDGDDVIFGDLGNDWLVGGTGKDHLYGGFGSDLLNADDDHDAGGANDTPDTADSYADIAYGGAGRDVLIGNTGGDRLIDWVGEFNSYIVPFAPFGAFTISRNVQPQIFDYLYDLSTADGADPTRTVDNPANGRNGEPYGEIGAVKQQDPFWQDQTGAPDDPQPGNIPGGKRDVMSAQTFNDPNAALIGLAADSGSWTAQGGQATVAPDQVGGEGVSVFHVDSYVPTYFEVQVDLSADKNKGGYDSNGYVILDYQGPEEFIFVGLNAKTDKIEIGHRDATGWHVDVQTNMRIRSDAFYNLLVAVNGTTVTALVDGVFDLTHTFAPRVVDGIPRGFNEGLIGFGANNSTTTIDNLVVQVLPPDLTYQNVEDFEDGQAQYFTGTSQGTWSLTGGALSTTPAAAEVAFNTLDLSPDAGFAPGALTLADNAKVKLTAELSTAGQGGLVFDLVSDTRYKFAVLDTASDQILIGHYEGGSDWVNDAAIPVAGTIGAGQTYTLELVLSGSTVSAALDGIFYGSTAFNAVTVDGKMGVIAKGGTASFDAVTVETDDATVALTLLDAMTASTLGTGGETVSMDDVEATKDEAVRRLSLMLGLTEVQTAALAGFDVRIGDLADAAVGAYDGRTVWIDVDAAGHGFFIDDTLTQDEEFTEDGTAKAQMDADGHIDLLSVMMHELGHVVGLEHDDAAGLPFMSDFIDPSQRLGLLDAANMPTAPQDADVQVYDAETDSMLSDYDAALLESVSDLETTETAVPTAPSPQNPRGKGKVKWAAE